MLDSLLGTSTDIVGSDAHALPQALASAPAPSASAIPSQALGQADVTAGKPAAAPTPATQQPAVDWRESLEPDYKQKMQRFNSPNELSKAYLELENKMSSSKRIPAVVDSPQALQDLQNATRPTSKEEYIRPEGMSDDQWAVATDAMFKAGIHPTQASVFLQDMLGSGDKVRNQMVEANKRFLFDTFGPTRTLQELQDVGALIKEATGNEVLAKAIQDFKVAPEVTQTLIALKNILQPGTLATLQRNNAQRRDPALMLSDSEILNKINELRVKGKTERDFRKMSEYVAEVGKLQDILNKRQR